MLDAIPLVALGGGKASGKGEGGPSQRPRAATLSMRLNVLEWSAALDGLRGTWFKDGGGLFDLEGGLGGLGEPTLVFRDLAGGRGGVSKAWKLPKMSSDDATWLLVAAGVWKLAKAD